MGPVLSFIAGTFFGALTGIIALALCVAARKGDELR